MTFTPINKSEGRRVIIIIITIVTITIILLLLLLLLLLCSEALHYPRDLEIIIKCYCLGGQASSSWVNAKDHLKPQGCIIIIIIVIIIIIIIILLLLLFCCC